MKTMIMKDISKPGLKTAEVHNNGTKEKMRINFINFFEHMVALICGAKSHSQKDFSGPTVPQHMTNTSSAQR